MSQLALFRIGAPINAVSAADVPADWIAAVAEALQREGCGVRAGGEHRIEVCRPGGAWLPLVPQFVNAEERNNVMNQLYPI